MILMILIILIIRRRYGRGTSPSSVFLGNKNSLQTIKTASRARCRMVRHALPTFPESHSPATATRCTRSPFPSLPSPLPVQLVPRSPYLRLGTWTSHPCGSFCSRYAYRCFLEGTSKRPKFAGKNNERNEKTERKWHTAPAWKGESWWNKSKS